MHIVHFGTDNATCPIDHVAVDNGACIKINSLI